MNIKLLIRALTRYILGIILVGILLFLPAQSFKYWNAYLFMGLLFIPMLIVGIIMMIKSPELLKKRLNLKERESTQEYVIAISGIMFISGFVIAGLNYKYKWIVIPDIIPIISSFVFLISYIIYGEVLRENSYLSRTIEVDKNQSVVDTGVYGIIRHPMYATTILLFLSMPLILGSFISFIIFLIYPFVIAIRINNEEKVLEKELKGYIEYKKRVKYKIIPFIW